MRAAVEQLAPTVGVAPACRALGVARASVYRHRPPPRPRRDAAPHRSPRALAPAERAHVLTTLHEDRFVDQAPAAVYASLLEEEPLPVLPAHDVPSAARRRRGAGTSPPAPPPSGRAAAAGGHGPQPGLDVGHHPPGGAAQMGDVSALRGPRSVFALRRGLDGGHPGKRRGS